MQGYRSALLLVLTGAGCAAAPRPAAPPPQLAPPPPPSPPAAESAPVNISMLVEAWGKDGMRIVHQGDTLHSGDRMALQVELDQPAYVYAMYADPAGKVHRLFPKEGDQQLLPGRRRVPALGQWLRLGNRTGPENLFVVAQTSPLQTTDLETRVQAQLQRDPPPAPKKRTARRPSARPRPAEQPSAAAAPSKDPPAPSMLTDLSDTETRDIALEEGTVMRLDARQGAILRFTFAHK